MWRKRIAPSETSPAVVKGVVYVGDWSGRVYAFAERTGKLWWTAQLHGEVKGGVAVAGRSVYVADYSSHVYALNAANGKLRWQASAQPRLGSTGRFYATPSVAYGRVYVGATDGKVYSFGAASGNLIWSTSTGGYVYSSTAVWHDRVYAGSYSHTLLLLRRRNRRDPLDASTPTGRSRARRRSSPAGSTSPRWPGRRTP